MKAGGEGGDRWWDGITDLMDMSLSKLWEIVRDRGAWCATVPEVTKSWTLLSDLTTIDSETSLKVQRLNEVGDTLICALEILEGP